MLKLNWQQKLRLWLWQQQRLLVLSGASLLAVILTLCTNLWLLAPVPALPLLTAPLLTLLQLGIAGLMIGLVLILLD